eukprot:gene14691-21584_t
MSSATTPSTGGDFDITDEMIDNILGQFESTFSSNLESEMKSIEIQARDKDDLSSPKQTKKLPRNTMWTKPADVPSDPDKFSSSTRRLGFSTRVETKLKSASRLGNLAVVKQLLITQGDGLNINATRSGGSGKTSLFCACENGHSEIVKVLLGANADPLLAAKTGTTPLSIAQNNGDPKTIVLIAAAAAAASQMLGSISSSGANAAKAPLTPEDAYLMPGPAALNLPAAAAALYVEPNTLAASALAGAVLTPEDTYLMPDPAALYVEPNTLAASALVGAAATTAGSFYETPVPAPLERTSRPTARSPPQGSTNPAASSVGPPPPPPHSFRPSPAVPPRSPRLGHRPLPASPGNSRPLTPSSPLVAARSPQRRATAMEPPSPKAGGRSPAVPARRKHTHFTFDLPLTPKTPAGESDDDSADDYCDLLGEDDVVLRGDETFNPGPLLREKKKATQGQLSSKPPAYVPAPKE